MANLQIACLGELQVTLAGAVLTLFQTDKNRALLLYLALEARAHPRAELAQFLWPGYSDESARSSLRQALHQLRQTLADPADTPWLLLTRQTVQINPDAPIGVDVLTFRHLLATCAHHAHANLPTCAPCLARLRQAVALYRGDFLAGFTVADSTPFEEWRRIRQEQLHVQMLDALMQLAAAAEAAGDDGQALDAARRLLTVEPWQEEAHRQVMRLLARQGQRAEALAQYQHCRQVLAEELGAAPDAETTALYEQIRRGEFDKVTRRQGDKMTTDHPVTLSPPHNLPAAQTPLIGRTQALTEIAERLQTPGTRLLTLVGPGGMGKTSLALAAGREQLTLFADGVWFVPLAAINTAALIPALANVLGVALPGGDPRSTLLQTVRPKQMLLLLDNFEHLLTDEATAVDLVVDLLEAAPRVQIIVTSRERLKLRSEQVYTVQPLPFADNATLAEATVLPAVRLFVQATQRSHAAFQLTTGNLAAVLRICRLVEGMPLGLELAAANAGGAPLTAIADAIAQSAAYLAVEWRDLPARQRSMRAVFGWSWQLLSVDEQRALRHIAIFRGGFDYAAAQAVIGVTLPLLTRLVDKSLLQWHMTATGEGRYVIHELLRQFAGEALATSGEQPLVEAQHGRYYLAYLAARGLRLGRHEPKEAADEIRLELDNVRLAWQWAVTQGRLAELDQAMYSWWQFCDLPIEGRESFGVAVAGVRRQLAQGMVDEAMTVLGQRLLAKLLAIHAMYLFAQDRDTEMAAQAQEAIALGKASGGVEGETVGSFVLGCALQQFEQYRAAGDQWRQTLQLLAYYQPDYPQSEMLHEIYWMTHIWLRGEALLFGDYAGSRAHLLAALQRVQQLGKRRSELDCLYALGQFDHFCFDFAAAEPSYQATLDLARTLGYRRMEMHAKDGLSGVARLRGDYATARTLLEETVTMAVELVLPYDEALMLAALIRLDCQLGDQRAAEQHHEQLTQLLTHTNLPKECQLYGWLAAAIKAHAMGNAQAARHFAEQAEQISPNKSDILFRLVDTALVVGHTRAGVAQWEGAKVAFLEALAAFQQLAGAHWARILAAEPLAGLAQIALAQGDLVDAQVQVEAILPLLAAEPHAGYNDPFFTYWICYRVLTAAGDWRATTVLQQGYDLLQQDAAKLDEESRHRFLTAVPLHRDLVTAYQALSAQS